MSAPLDLIREADALSVLGARWTGVVRRMVRQNWQTAVIGAYVVTLITKL